MDLRLEHISHSYGDVEVLQLLETAPVHEGIYVIDLFPE